MSAQYQPRTNVASERVYRCRLLGANGADPTKEFGPGLTVTRSSEGIYKFSFNENPGEFVGIGGYMLGDTTPADVKNKIVTRGAYTAPSGSTDGYVLCHVFESGTLDDIEATEYLDITFVFAAQNV